MSSRACGMGPTVRVPLRASRLWRGRTVRPLQGRPRLRGFIRGRGHQKRALAHGYSIGTPAGFRGEGRRDASVGYR